MGASVICIESQAKSGGNLNGVEGCFGIGSRMQKEKGITIDPGATIRSELAASQLRASGPGYVDMVHNSGENIDWLLDNGVTFSDVDVDKGNLMVFHRFASGTGAKDFVEPMTAKAEELGVDIRYNTAGTLLIQDDSGKVTGLYADGPDGSIQINAKAVIIATGGFADNETFMSEVGLDSSKRIQGGFPGHDGSGHIMAVNAGAKSYRPYASFLFADYVKGLPGYYDNGKWSFMIGIAAPYAIWVNETGDRFVNEDCPAENIMLMYVPALRNKTTYVIMDSKMLDMYTNGDNDAITQLNNGLSSGEIIKANTIAELADSAGLDADGLTNTISEYNGFVTAGSDENYGKSAELLMPISQAPYYGVHIVAGMNTSIGSIYTDRSFHALDENDNPIDGLYVVGVEGAMLWANIYTINVSGGCNANNVNSARTAVKDAIAHF